MSRRPARVYVPAARLNVTLRVELAALALARARFRSAATRLAANSARYRPTELAYRGTATAAAIPMIRITIINSNSVNAVLLWRCGRAGFARRLDKVR